MQILRENKWRRKRVPEKRVLHTKGFHFEAWSLEIDSGDACTMF